MKLTNSRRILLSNFLNDIAKAYFLTGFVGQPFFIKEGFFPRLIFLVFSLLATCFFLYTALKLSPQKEI